MQSTAMPANIRPITIPGFAGKLADVIEQIRELQAQSDDRGTDKAKDKREWSDDK